jgi:Fe2+ or Zn2+ uptake regulation protein
VLQRAKEPISIVEVEKKLIRAPIDRVTLYRTLETLVDVSIVRPVDLRHGHVDYELIEEGKHHHHIICEKCGYLEDFEWCADREAEEKALKATKHFASLSDHSYEFFGICKKCASIKK